MKTKRLIIKLTKYQVRKIKEYCPKNENFAILAQPSIYHEEMAVTVMGIAKFRKINPLLSKTLKIKESKWKT